MTAKLGDLLPQTGIRRDSYTQTYDSADSYDGQQPYDGQLGPTKHVVGLSQETLRPVVGLSRKEVDAKT